jgi:hypothetical protein
MMDREDVLYALGGATVSAGAACVYWPAGLVTFGVFLALPSLISLLRGRNENRNNRGQ